MFRHLRREAYLIMAFAASLLMMTGCDMFRMESQEPIGWHVGESCLRSTNGLTAINLAIGNPNADCNTRRRAVAELFANYIRPGARSIRMRDTITSREWIRQSNITRPEIITGGIPIDRSVHSVLYIIQPFTRLEKELDRTRYSNPLEHNLTATSSSGSMDWTIYASFTREISCYSNGAALFLEGIITNDLVRLEAFTLCIPGAVFRENQFMRYEQFTYKGILVFNE